MEAGLAQEMAFRVNLRNSTVDVLLGVALSALLALGAWTVRQLADIDARLARVETAVSIHMKVANK